MATSDERMLILRMIEQGKISAEEGTRLLAALAKGRAQEPPPRPDGFDTAHTLQVRVTELGTNRMRADVAIPVGLATLFLRRLPAGVSPEADRVRDALARGAPGRLLEVVDQEQGVRVELRLR